MSGKTNDQRDADGITREPAEASAAKDVVLIELQEVVEDANGDGEKHDAITLADMIIERLLDAGVLTPEWIPEPLAGAPTQGHTPTPEQLAEWEGRANIGLREAHHAG